MNMNELVIGHVIGVHGDTVDVQICIEDLHIPYGKKLYHVGRLGTYCTIPMVDSILIGYVTSVGVRGELEPRPLPAAPRRIAMEIQLLGTARGSKFLRGVNEYPTLGDPVQIGVDEDFAVIFGTFDDLAKS